MSLAVNYFDRNGKIFTMLFYTILLCIVTTCCLYILSKIAMKIRYHYHFKCHKNYFRMDGKTILITEATSGTGRSIAEYLVAQGAKVIMACRNISKAEEVADEIRNSTGIDPKMLSVVHLDFIDLNSVRECAKKITASEDRIDVLFNNAGLGLSPFKLTKQGYDYVFGVNYVGPFLLTYLLIDLLKKSSPSRVINVIPCGDTFLKEEPDFSRQLTQESDIKYPNLFGYNMSKLAQIWHAKILSEKLKDYQVSTISVHTGSGSKITTDQKMLAKIVSRFFDLISRKFNMLPRDAALTVAYLAMDPNLEDMSGQYFENMKISQNLSPYAKDKQLAQKMWDVSMEMCGLCKKNE
ncbi:retinol dehydrogenase 14 [Octopus bimaculoides]|uniref:Uncharacterized protein n=1 Tax=Octopus bimaculoides TaxID=37653 RepID=A0A0L8HLA9_OCTBM|nr:retinol dehydrogenase 14 [Octopus bimaculoides]|eukprot:XP_014771442.1 PREDICTED: retinol dehydrogenase 14-like [Octopus bimaculoides]